MDIPSVNLAGLLIVLGLVMGTMSIRNLYSPPPQYADTMSDSAITSWLGLGCGMAMLGGGISMATKAWLMISQLPPSLG